MAKEVFQLEVQIQTNPALTGLNAVDAKLKQVKATADSIGKSTSTTGINSLTTSTKTLTTALGGLGSVIAGIGFAKIATEAVQTLAAFETLKTVLETVTGSITGATAAMAQLRDVSKVTPFSVQDLGAAFINLKVNGVDPTSERLKLFADIASVTADKVGTLQAVTNLFARNMQGGLNLQDLNVLANAGIPVFDVLAKKLGVTRGQIAQLGQSAEGAGIILRTLESELGSRFGGAALKNMETLNGQFSTLLKNIQEVTVARGEAGITDGLKDLLKVLNEVVTTSGGSAQTIGSVLGGALKGLATAIKFVSDNFLLIAGTLLVVVGYATGVGEAFTAVLLALRAFGPAIMTFLSGIRLLFTNFAALTEGLSFFRGAWVAVTEVFSTFIGLLGGPGRAIGQFFASLDKVLSTLLGRWGANIAEATGLFYILDKIKGIFGSTPEAAKPKMAESTAGAGRGAQGGATSAEMEQAEKDKARAADLATGRTVTANKILDGLKQELSLIGKSKEKQEEQVKVEELHRSMKEKLVAAGKTELEAETQVTAQLTKTADGVAQVAAIRAAVAAKHNAEVQFQYSEMVKNSTFEISMLGKSGNEVERQTKLREQLVAMGERDTNNEKLKAQILAQIDKELAARQANSLAELAKQTNFEVSLLGLSSNEIERQTKLREQLVAIGKRDTATEAEKLEILKQIDKLREAQITEGLKKNLEGINRETDYLKLGNAEREKRIELDRIAGEQGFKNAEEFAKKRPVEFTNISKAIDVKAQTGIDVEARKNIDALKEERDLLLITNDLDRERAKKKLDIYKAIDPEGKGKKINDMQKSEIDALLAQIEAQNKLLEVNKKIEDSFASLGSAVSNWVLGSTNGIQQVKLELLKLITLEALKYFNGGMPGGASGSFLNGVLSGLSGTRAEGGPVAAGKSYLVGEKRPEVFVPTQNGYIVPNTAMMNTSTGHTTVTMAPNLIIQGSVTGQTELENMFDQFSTAIAQETKNFVISQRGQNGILAR